MRERLLGAFLALTALTVLLYAVPRAFIRSGIVHDQAQQQMEMTAEAAAAVVRARGEAGRPLGGGLFVRFDKADSVVLETPTGWVALAGTAPTERAHVRATRPVPQGTVVASRPDAAVRAQTVREIKPIAATGALALLVAAGAAVLLSRRISRPLQVLAASVAELGGTGSAESLPKLPGREAEAIAAALRASAARLAAVQRQERAFARNVSHQLRTPLTAVRLRVEGLSLDPSLPPDLKDEVDHVLSEVDRLADTITVLLAFSRRKDLGARTRTAPDELVAEAVRRWTPMALLAGRTLRADGPGAPDPVLLPSAFVDQAVDVLVHNALRHGRGTVTVSAETADGEARFAVTDEGSDLAGVTDEEVFGPRDRATATEGSEGVGLALVAQLAAAAGADLRLASRAPTSFVLRVPV